MAKAFDAWNVLEHGPIEKLSDNLWRVDGALPGMSLRRVMTLARLDDGGVVVHSAIALGEAEMAALEAWGTPRYLVVPSGIHRLDASAFKRRYPLLRVVAPRGARAKVSEVVPVDLTYEDFPIDPTVQLRTLQGVADAEGVMTVRSSDGVSVVLNDVMFNMDTKRDVMGWLFTTVLGSAPGPRVSRLAKLMLVKDSAALRREFERLAELPDLVRLIVSHEKLAVGPAAADALRRAAAYL